MPMSAFRNLSHRLYITRLRLPGQQLSRRQSQDSWKESLRRPECTGSSSECQTEKRLFCETKAKHEHTEVGEGQAVRKGGNNRQSTFP